MRFFLDVALGMEFLGNLDYNHKSRSQGLIIFMKVWYNFDDSSKEKNISN